MRYRIAYLMDEGWERAVKTALAGQTDDASVVTLTLDGAVKCAEGRLPSPRLLEKFQNLKRLSITNIGLSSLEQFPRLRSLENLILSDNRIAGGLGVLAQAKLNSLRDLDLSNNRIQYIEDLAPLSDLKLDSLDLYECPVTKVKDYRDRVFGLIKSLKYLDKMDAEGNERPESDDEEEEEEEEEDDDPGSGEIDGDVPNRMENGHRFDGEGIVDVDEDEESDADEEVEIARNESSQVSHRHSNGFGVVNSQDVDDDEDEGEDEEENVSGEEIDDEDGVNDDVVEIHEIDDSEDDEDGVEDDEDEEDEEDEEVDNEDGDFVEPENTGRLISTEGEIDGHEQGEDDADEDDNGETGEEEQGVAEDGGSGDEEEEDYESGFLVQPVVQAGEDAGGSDMDPGNEAEEEEEEVADDDEQVPAPAPAPAPGELKRKRHGDIEDDEDDDVVYSKPTKHR